jgi:hypothetical protein
VASDIEASVSGRAVPGRYEESIPPSDVTKVFFSLQEAFAQAAEQNGPTVAGLWVDAGPFDYVP